LDESSHNGKSIEVSFCVVTVKVKPRGQCLLDLLEYLRKFLVKEWDTTFYRNAAQG
jgi:hypothetical protein